MVTKILILATMLVATRAQHYIHGHATSSQSIIRHDNQHYQAQPVHTPIVYQAPIHFPSANNYNLQHGSHYAHSLPIIHSSPIRHSTALITQSAPISYHASPIAHHPRTISFQHGTPITHYATPAITLQHAPIHYNHQYAHAHQDYHAHPRYEFEYSVNDPHTGDIKSQHESRDGDVVTGSYSLHESDGTVRTVHYNADAHNGFNANVERSGHSTHIQPVQYSPHYAVGHH